MEVADQRGARAPFAVLVAHRLRHNVIKTGLRRLSLSYSRISFADVAAKLSLGTAEDAEFVCAKAVRDGVIDVELDHEAGCLRSKVSGVLRLQ